MCWALEDPQMVRAAIYRGRSSGTWCPQADADQGTRSGIWGAGTCGCRGTQKQNPALRSSRPSSPVRPFLFRHTLIPSGLGRELQFTLSASVALVLAIPQRLLWKFTQRHWGRVRPTQAGSGWVNTCSGGSRWTEEVNSTFRTYLRN